MFVGLCDVNNMWVSEFQTGHRCLFGNMFALFCPHAKGLTMYVCLKLMILVILVILVMQFAALRATCHWWDTPVLTGSLNS